MIPNGDSNCLISALFGRYSFVIFLVGFTGINKPLKSYFYIACEATLISLKAAKHNF